VRTHVKESSAGPGMNRAAFHGSVVLFLLAVLAFLAPARALAARPPHPPLTPASISGLAKPCGATTDSAGNLYVADSEQAKIKVFDPEGAPITEFTPSANGVAPCSIAVDSAGRLYATTFFGTGAEVVRYEPSSFPPTGSTTYEADLDLNGNGVLVPAASKATSVAVNPADDSVYVAEAAKNEEQQVTFSGFVTGDKFTLTCDGEATAEIEYATTGATLRTRIKTALEAKCGAGNFATPGANPPIVTFQGKYTGEDVPRMTCAATSGAGSCEVTAEVNGLPSHVSTYTPDGTKTSGSIGAGLVSGAILYGVGVYGANGNVYVTDKAHNEVYVLNSAGDTILHEIDGSTSPDGAFTAMAQPFLAVDQTNGNVLVSDVPGHGVVDEFSEDGDYVTTISNTPAFTDAPTAIAVDSSSGDSRGNVYVTSADGSVYRFGALPSSGLALKVTKAGNGAGTVTSSPLGINCGGVCEGSFEEGSQVTLTAAPAAGSGVTGWSGCDSESPDHAECTVTVVEALEVTVTFETRTLKLAKQGNGTAVIMSDPAGISCAESCESAQASFPPGTEITLTAAPAAGSRLKSWQGCESSSGDECTLTLDQDREVTATISAKPSIAGLKARPHATDAMLRAQVNPNGEATTYQFQYLTQDEWEDDGESFAGATSIPASPGAIGEGLQAIPVQGSLLGLEPETAYRYRLIAENLVDAVEAEASFVTYALPQVLGSCANDEFRINRSSGTLPDCRAYEQATPVDKNGGNVQSEYFLNKASPSGNRISFEVIAGLPIGEGSQTFPTFASTRAGGQWSSQGVLPAASSGEQARILGWTPDFDQVFSVAAKLGTGTGLVSRSSADGSLAVVVPHTPALAANKGAIRYVGASADGSQSFFEAVEGLAGVPGTPAPAAGLVKDNVYHYNLYAWNRDTGNLYFAGALPDGSAPGAGATAGGRNENYYWIDTRAVAEDGSVYFTDQKTGQLYRRLNPTAPETTDKDTHGDCVPDPLLACTVHVSASEKDDGHGLEGHDAAGPQATRFMAASTDGAKAIFTSSEKLTNDAYTGPETTEPPAIARANLSDVAGSKEIGWLPTSADAVVVDGEYVYWTDPEHDRVGRAKLDKSLYEEGFITGLSNLKDLAVIDEPGTEYIFWTSPAEGEEEKESPISGEGEIGRADLDGENVNPGCLEDVVNPNGIAANSEHIYWTSPDTDVTGFTLGEGAIRRAALDCSAASVETLTEEGLGSGDVAVDTSHIYLSFVRRNSGNGYVTRFNLNVTEGISVAEAPSSNDPPAIAIDGAHIYWTNPAASTIGRANLDGSSREDDFITAAGHSHGIAVDSEHLYWSANQEIPPNDGSDLYTYDSGAPAGERLTDLAPSHDGDDGVEVQGVLGASADASHVYFVANGVPDGDIANSPNANGEEAAAGDCKGTLEENPSGVCNLYLAHEGEITFIARLEADNHNTDQSSSDSSNWVASVSEIGLANVSEKTARVSRDGKTLLFRSQRQLTDYDNDGPECSVNSTAGTQAPGPCPELYLYRVGEPGPTCVSCNPTGAAPDGYADLVTITVGQITAAEPSPLLSRNLSASGDRVFFETEDALVAEDTNADEGCPLDDSYKYPAPSCRDAYEWEAAGTGSCPGSAGQQGCIYLISTGKSPHPSFFADASESGDDAFFFTFSKLVRQDEDDLLDVYDARAGGGLASQDVLPPVPCEGEACKGPAGSAPQSPSAGTQGFSGPGDPKPVHKKAKHRKRKKAKHRKKKHQRHAKKRHHRAKTDGRASR
jgi:Divergent InlB B-repeat domain